MKRLSFAAFLFLLGVFFSSPARAQIVIQIRDGSGTILGTFPTGVVTFKAGSNFAFNVSGTTVTLTSTGGTGSSFNILVNGLAVTDPSAVSLSDSTPAAPSGRTNVLWNKDSSSPTNISASIPNCAEGLSHSAGIVPDPGGTSGTTKFLREDCTWQSLTVFYQTVQAAGTPATQRPNLNFLAPIVVADNSGNSSTDVSVPVFGASGGSHSTGLVPDPGSSAGTKKYLREDGSWIQQPYDIGFFNGSAPGSSQILLNLPVGRAFTLASGASGQATVTVLATASTVFAISQNGSSIGTITCTSASLVCTVSISSLTTFTAGDVLTVTAPASPDATLAGLGATLTGLRN